MNSTSPSSDPARFYQDKPFPGRRLLASAVGLWLALALLPRSIPEEVQLPAWVATVVIILFLLTVSLYFVGFWKAVIGKGYPRILFLISLVPPIGLLAIYFLPCRDDGNGNR
ncbi:MAG: hypothetical protein AAGH89_06015 [Verrucomicrobiota bacterium]